MKNIKLNEGFTQVCVWPGTIIKEDQIDDFTAWALSEFNTRVQYLETIETAPDRDENNYLVEGTGGRHDVFFAVHDNDVGHFAVPRLAIGVRWIEDAISQVNGGNRLYPARVTEYGCW